VKWHILVGFLTAGAAVLLLGIIALNEPARMESFSRSYHSRQIEEGARIFENNCRPCHGPQGEGSPLAPALNTPPLFNGERLAAVSFPGTLQDYLKGVVASGRPVPSEGTNYPQRMPTWSQEFGGPLRPDQIESVVAFILNWEERALAGEPATPVSGGPGMGTDITVQLPPGDAERGRALAEATLGCTVCHGLTPVGPAWTPEGGLPGLGDRAAQRIAGADYTGAAQTPEQYLVESVVQPNAFVVPGFDQGIMPADFGNKVTLQDMADLLAYMLSFR
jgi:mono/diheme cytochrome c family protein